MICLAGIGWSVLLLNLQARLFQMNIYLANLIAIFLVSLWNFGFNPKFGWKKGQKVTPLICANER